MFLRSASLIVIITFISKMTGFFRELFLGIKFGTTYEADAYIIAMTVPMIIFTSIIISAMTCFIPIYSEIKSNKGKNEALNFTNNIINIVTVLAIIIVLFVIFFTEPTISIVAGGFEGDTLNLAIDLLKLSATMMIFMGISQICMAYLQSNDSYLVSAGNNVLANIIVIIGFLLSDKIGIKGVCIVSIIGSFTQIIVQYPAMKKLGYKYKLLINLKDKYFKKMIKLFIPILLSTAVLEINMLIDRTLASRLPEGSIAALNYANKLNLFVFGIISVSIATIVFPKLSQYNSIGNTKAFANMANSSINIITLLTAPILIFVIFFSVNIVKVLFEYGSFDSIATQMTASALIFYSIGMLFMGYREILNKIFYSIHNTKIPMRNSIFATIFNIILNIVLINSMKHNGLALASSLALLISTILMFISLKKLINEIALLSIIDNIVKSIGASIISCFFIKKIFVIITTSYYFNMIQEIILIGVLFLIYILLYVIIGIVFKIGEFRELNTIITRKFLFSKKEKY